MTVDDLLARLRGQFDADDATILAWINDRYQRIVARSRWMQAQKALGTTNAGQTDYSLETTVTNLSRIRTIDQDNGEAVVCTYDWVPLDAMWDLDSSPSSVALQGTGGVFADDPDPDGDTLIRLYPAPDQTGLTIIGLTAIEATPLVAGSGSEHSIPADFHVAILEGARADGYREVDERLDMAQAHEALFQGAAEELRRRRNSRFGKGPIQIQYRGVHF